MDLLEKTHNYQRHPWEAARLRTFLTLIDTYNVLKQDGRILDVGCGDGFFVHALAKKKPWIRCDAIDSNLSDTQCAALETYPNVHCYHHYGAIPSDTYHMLFLLDIIEHVENDHAFLMDMATRYSATQGHILISVPAFQSLYSHHDRFLGHYRRYSLSQLKTLIQKSGLQEIACGYLFSSLLPFRAIGKIMQRFQGAYDEKKYGIGNWNKPDYISKPLEYGLYWNNRLQLFLSGKGIHIPGLSVWILCKK